MFRCLALLGLLLCFAPSVSAQSQPLPSVVVLRDAEPEGRGVDIYHGQAILLNAHARVLGTIAGLGVSQSVSYQSKVLIDDMNARILLVENLRDRVSIFDAKGRSKTHFPLENAGSIVLSDDARTIGCTVGNIIGKHQTVFLDAITGKEIRRLNWGGVALTNDVAGSRFWSAGKQLIAFSHDGEIHVRRPLTRLPAETDHPTVINSRNWCGIGVVVEPNRNPEWRDIWVIERDHPDVKGSRNRLFAVDPNGRTRILVELREIDPRSIACATYQGDLTRILVVDGATGDLVSFNSDGELTRIDGLEARLVGFGKHSGLWVAGRKSIKRLDPSDLSVVAEHNFKDKAEPVGLAVR